MRGIVAVLFCLLALASATDTYMQVAVQNRKFTVKVSLANFGYFKYGHRLSGRVHIGANYTNWGDGVDAYRVPLNSSSSTKATNITFDVNNSDLLLGCRNDFQRFNEEYIAEFGSPIYFVERGNCTFTRKASNAARSGKMLIIADNSDEEDVAKIIMGEDLSGETIMIPVVMISKNDGAMIRDFLFSEMADLNTRDVNSQVRISIIFNKPHEGEKAEIQYWMVPAEKDSYEFLSKHTEFLNSLIL